MPAKSKDADKLNQGIRARELMVISDDGEKLGVMSKNAAIDMAFERGLDLFLVAPNAKPPVGKFMDYNKYKYEQKRKKREARKNQNTTELKELRLSPKIQEHDLQTKIRKGREFLEDNDKLKLSIRFRGREMAFTDQGREVMMQFADRVKDVADVESMPKRDGRNMFMTLKPKKDK
ncbi:MAG: translation initiation factor IF-3 [Candidatus Izemoplasma sp.]|nr:translation initiation factor IF-3 [Candidatus Izemoplasma sp.]